MPTYPEIELWFPNYKFDFDNIWMLGSIATKTQIIVTDLHLSL